MSDTVISEAAKAKYISITGYKYGVDNLDQNIIAEHFARFIQEVSDAAKDITKHGLRPGVSSALSDFILPEPVDPLVEALRALDATTDSYESEAVIIRRELTKRGFKIVPAGQP